LSRLLALERDIDQIDRTMRPFGDGARLHRRSGYREGGRWRA
jgi:hypothetical protein